MGDDAVAKMTELLEALVSEETRAHKEIKEGLERQKRSFSVVDILVGGFGGIVVVIMTLMGYTYKQDQAHVQAQHVQFANQMDQLSTTQKNISDKQIRVVTVLERIEEKQQAIEKDVRKLNPDKPRFDSHQHDELHRFRSGPDH